MNMKTDCMFALLRGMMSVSRRPGRLRHGCVRRWMQIEGAALLRVIRPLSLVVDEDLPAGGALAWSSNAEAPLPPPVPR